MRRLALPVAAIGLFIGSAAFALAQDSDRGKSESAPGQQMNEKGPVPGSPGASGYAPGHRMERGTDLDRDKDVDRDRK